MNVRAILMAIGITAAAARAEVWYVPGWMRTQEPESGAWSSFTNVFPSSRCEFWKWDGDHRWSKSVANADAASQRLADELKAMPASRRAGLTIVGHSLGGRIVARALARLGEADLKVAQGMLLAPAIPAFDPDVERMGRGSGNPLLVVVNPQDVTLKYVYAMAGGEGGPSLGTDGSRKSLENVVECSVPEDITDTTEISDLWGRTDAVKRIANHHASFYFAELGRILEGSPSPRVQMMVPQDKVNVEWKVVDAGVWWDVLDVREGWKLERHILTKHCRILNPDRKRTAWGDERSMRESFEKVKRQLSGE